MVPVVASIAMQKKDLLLIALLLIFQDVKERKVIDKLVHIDVVERDYVERYDSSSSDNDRRGISVVIVLGMELTMVDLERYPMAVVVVSAKDLVT